jgi:hypothetical protein
MGRNSFAEERVFANVTLKEFIVEQEEEAVEALAWGEVKLGDGDSSSSG